ncbi:CTP synthase [Spirochaetota bacterium]|nr:CTP synthase [Spirochaetota bacterium]
MNEYSPLQNPCYIVVTGGVISGLGKGVLTASLAALFKEDYKVICIKCDGYLNADPGTINPTEHGEVYVLDDGGEVDMDFGHYERLIGIRARREFNITMGKVYKQLLENERRGTYLGKTVQLIPHATNEIKERIYKLTTLEQADIVFIEIGGTVGDMENELFIETIRQIRSEVNRQRMLFVHLTHIPIVEGSRELKSKPTQTSVKTLNRSGIYPDLIFCRTDREITDEIRNKISLYCNVAKEAVISDPNVKDINLLAQYFEAQNVHTLLEKYLKLTIPGLSPYKKQLLQTLASILNSKPVPPTANSISPSSNNVIQPVANTSKEHTTHASRSEKYAHLNIKNSAPHVAVNIAICGKYTKLEDSYVSIREALSHAAVHITEKLKKVIRPNISFLDVTAYHSAGQKELKTKFKDIAGIIIPGGFGLRGIEEKILIIKHARETHIPFMGICLGMQLAVIEYARHVCGISNANSEEVITEPVHPHIDTTVPTPSVPHAGHTNPKEHHPSHSSLQTKQSSSSQSASVTPVIHLIEEQKYVTMVGGTMRLGSYDVLLKPHTLVSRIYGEKPSIRERFRHRYEVNNAYVSKLEAAGLVFSGMAANEEAIMQIVELPDHACFIAGQFHPELLSTLEKPAPFFLHFVEAAVNHALKSMS